MPAKRKDDDGPVTGVQAFADELRAQRESAGPGMLGSFLVASFETDRDAAYLDNALDGQATERRNQVVRAQIFL